MPSVLLVSSAMAEGDDDKGNPSFFSASSPFILYVNICFFHGNSLDDSTQVFADTYYGYRPQDPDCQSFLLSLTL